MEVRNGCSLAGEGRERKTHPMPAGDISTLPSKILLCFWVDELWISKGVGFVFSKRERERGFHMVGQHEAPNAFKFHDRRAAHMHLAVSLGNRKGTFEYG